MKILFYISTIRGGGAGRVMSNLANQFVLDGIEVCFVTNFPAKQEYFLDSAIHRYSLETVENKENPILKNYNRISKLRKIIRIENPEIVVSFMHENDVRAFIATRGLGAKLLLSVRNDPAVLYRSKRRGAVAKFVYGNADAVVFQTEEAKNWFVKLKGKTRIIYNQVAPEFYNVKRESENCKDIVTTGKFMLQKNHQMLMEAFCMIKDEIEENLIIYGNGMLEENYRTFIEENHMEQRIFLPGSCSNVAETIVNSKLFVMPSNYEGMPNALMEAMALGIPCISTDCPCGGPKELSGESESVDLIEVGNVEMLAEKMKRMLLDERYLSVKSFLVQKKSRRFQAGKNL